MFLYTVNFTHQFSFCQTFSTAIKIALELLPRKNEVENACHTQSCWIVALLLHGNLDFYAVARESVFFMLYY